MHSALTQRGGDSTSLRDHTAIRETGMPHVRTDGKYRLPKSV